METCQYIFSTPSCENLWIWALDTMCSGLHTRYNTLICISVAQGVDTFMAFIPYLATLDLLLMPNVNGMQRLCISINRPFLY